MTTAQSQLIAAISEETQAAREVEVTRNRYGYEVDGQYLRRVTTLLGGIPKPWLGPWSAKMVAEYAVDHRDAWVDLPRTDAVKLLKGAPNTKKEDAGDRGAAVHNTIEAVVHGKPMPDDLTDDERDCSLAAQAYMKERGAKVLACELTVFNLTVGYAGTLDLWSIAPDGVTWIEDWKTSASIHVEHAIQQVAYQNAEYALVNKRPGVGTGSTEKWRGKLIPWGPDVAQRLGVVHVQPTGATLYPILDSEAGRLWDVFRAAAHIKQFQADTDGFKKAPRVSVYGDPIEVTTNEEAA